MAQHEKLTAFYRAYNDWLEKGAPHTEPFLRYAGLCSNLVDWCTWADLSLDTSTNLLEEMVQQFEDAGLHRAYPFNTGVGNSYSEDKRYYQMHLNDARNKWVKNHCQ